MSYVLGIDIGGSGSRLALRHRADSHTRWELTGDRVAITGGGSTVPLAVLDAVRRARAAWPDRMVDLSSIAVGATGLATLVADPAQLVARLEGEAPGAAVAVAVDAVTAHLGALGGGPGAVVALGTGAIAVGGDGDRQWLRVDGWGHLLGDRGGGAWIGRCGLASAIRAHDGVDGSGAALLAAARGRFGEVASWPAQLYTRDDRAGVLAAFAVDVIDLAERGDEAAYAIVTAAGREAARSATAALAASPVAVVAATGGLARSDSCLMTAFASELAATRPDATHRPAAGSPLDGALLLAERAARGTVTPVRSFVWTRPAPAAG